MIKRDSRLVEIQAAEKAVLVDLEAEISTTLLRSGLIDCKIGRLGGVCRILCDIHHTQSLSRRAKPEY